MANLTVNPINTNNVGESVVVNTGGKAVGVGYKVYDQSAPRASGYFDNYGANLDTILHKPTGLLIVVS